jgi:hypothetical protein
MLRKLSLKNREIPISVPLLTLGEAIRWIEEDLLSKEVVLVSLVLDDKELINELYRKSVRDLLLKESSKVQIKVETPKDLSNQSLEVVCDLAYGIRSRIGRMDIDLWKDLNPHRKLELEELTSDLRLLMELISHIKGLVEDFDDLFLSILDLNDRLAAGNHRLEDGLHNDNLHDIVYTLGMGLDPCLQELVREGEALQIQWLVSRVV